MRCCMKTPLGPGRSSQEHPVHYSQIFTTDHPCLCQPTYTVQQDPALTTSWSNWSHWYFHGITWHIGPTLKKTRILHGPARTVLGAKCISTSHPHPNPYAAQCSAGCHCQVQGLIVPDCRYWTAGVLWSALKYTCTEKHGTSQHPQAQ